MYYFKNENERVEINENNIWHKSGAKNVVMLPYGEHADVKSGRAAEIRVDLPHPIEGIKLRLIMPAGSDDSKSVYRIHAEDWEVMNLLDAFFGVTHGGQGEGTGLDRYWFGHYQANYLVWREVTNNPLILMYKLKESTGYWFGHYQANYLVWREVTNNPLILMYKLKERLPDLDKEVFTPIYDAIKKLEEVK